jgi:hypothetical protein
MDKIHLQQTPTHSDACGVSVRELFRTMLRESIIIPAIEGIMGWLVYNGLISLYGFSWIHAALFGLMGYLVQAALFEPLRQLIAKVSKTLGKHKRIINIRRPDTVADASNRETGK